MLQQHVVQVPIYRHSLHVSVGPYTDWTRYVRSEHPDQEFDFGVEPKEPIIAMKTIECGLDQYIWLSEFDHSPHDHALVAHESIHVAFSILSTIGVRLCDESLEALTYLAQWVTQTTLEFLGTLTQVHKKDDAKGSVAS